MLRPWRLQLDVQIDGNSPVPIYIQVVNAIVHEIERGRLRSGEFLPSTRELAKLLGVNRKTVVLACEDLVAQGWLDSAGTSGTKVAEALEIRVALPIARLSMRVPMSAVGPTGRWRRSTR